MKTEAGRSPCLIYSPSLRSPKVSTASKALKQTLPKVSWYCNSQVSRGPSLPLKIHSSFAKVENALSWTLGPLSIPNVFSAWLQMCVWVTFLHPAQDQQVLPQMWSLCGYGRRFQLVCSVEKANDFNVEFWLHTGAEPFKNSGFIKPIHNHEQGSLCKYPRYFWTSQFPFPINSRLDHLIAYSQPLSRGTFLMLTPS